MKWQYMMYLWKLNFSVLNKGKAEFCSIFLFVSCNDYRCQLYLQRFIEFYLTSFLIVLANDKYSEKESSETEKIGMFMGNQYFFAVALCS